MTQKMTQVQIIRECWAGIKAQLAIGTSIREVAEDYGVSYGSLRTYLTREKHGLNSKLAEKRELIIELHESGLRSKEIAKQVGSTDDNIRSQLCSYRKKGWI